MAKAIRVIERKTPSEEEVRAESLGEILQAISENRAAIVAFLEILKEMHDAGILDIAKGVLKNRASLGSLGLEFVQVAHIPTMLKNVILAAQFIGRLDPKETEKLISGITSGLKQAMQTEDDSGSLWSLLGMMKDPDVKASVSTTLHFLQGMGEELRRKEEDRPVEQ